MREEAVRTGLPGTNPGSYQRSQVQCRFQEAWYELHRSLRRARWSLVQIVQIVRIVRIVLRTPRAASPTQDTPVRGGSNPGPKRSGAVDGALPVEVHLRSWGRGAQSGAEVVRPGSYPVSRVVPKKPSRMPPSGGLVRTLPKPKTRARVGASYRSYRSTAYP
jgi:hypothetical protein